MKYHRITLLTCVVCTTCSAFAEEPVSFSKDIAPILQAKCVTCHGPQTSEADYRVDSYSHLLHTDSDETAISPGNVAESALFQRLISQDPELRMPAEADPLPQKQIDLLRRWIASGARFDGVAPSAPLAELTPAIVHPAPPRHYPASLPLSAIAFGRTGTEIRTSGYHEITVWNSAGKLIRRTQNQGERTYSLDLHPLQPLLLSASGTPGESGEVRLFHDQSGELISVVLRANETILVARFSPDGKRIAAAHPDGSVRILSSKTLATEQTLLGHSGQVTSLVWHPDGMHLVTASRDKTGKVFDVAAARSLATFTGHTECVNALALLNDEEIISGGDDGKLLRWSVPEGQKKGEVLAENDRILSIAVCKKFYVATGAKAVYRFDVDSHRELGRDDNGGDWSTVIAADPSRQYVAIGSQQSKIILRNADGEMSSFVAKP